MRTAQKLVLAVHLTVVIAIMSLASLFAACPSKLLGALTFVIAFLVVATNSGGECLLTRLEKEMLINEGAKVYDAPCIQHYIEQWFRIPTPALLFPAIYLLLFVIGLLRFFRHS